MASQTTSKLGALSETPGALVFNRGIERETLRVSEDGNLARTPHPAVFGSKLTHPQITTDFSESQPELITSVSDSIETTLEQLEEIHRFVESGLGNELMWASSMPCVLQGDNSIPLAQYGTSNLARLKTTYRHGLGLRYGRAMQTICAVHYNFSFSETFWGCLSRVESADANDLSFRSRRYFDLMRNFRRFSWLPVYLFGASPAVCKSFVRGRQHALDEFDEGSLYGEHATSLRSGNLGYQSELQGGMVNVCYNSLANYVQHIARAICTPHADYQKLGLWDDRLPLQVNASILQSEAEFYSTIRAKRVPPKGANFLKVLLAQGVEYLEVRLLDVNPYLPTGIDADQIRFLDTFLLYCLLTNSPEHDEQMCQAVASNVRDVVWRGRDPALLLVDGSDERSVRAWGLELMAAMTPVAAALDEGGGTDHRDSLAIQRAKLEDPSLTPSARILSDMRSGPMSFFRFAMNRSLAHRDYFRSKRLPKARLAWFEATAKLSMDAQREIESADVLDFETYLANLNAAYQDLQ